MLCAYVIMNKNIHANNYLETHGCTYAYILIDHFNINIFRKNSYIYIYEYQCMHAYMKTYSYTRICLRMYAWQYIVVYEYTNICMPILILLECTLLNSEVVHIVHPKLGQLSR